jgi:hypothetical protein
VAARPTAAPLERFPELLGVDLVRDRRRIPASHGTTALDPIDDRDRVESLSLLPRHVAAAIP